MRLLVSPDNVEEALACVAAAEYFDVLDVKKPDEGSLGANYPWVIKAIRDAAPEGKPVSATLGDAPYKPGTLAQAALGAAVSGANYIKFGIAGTASVTEAITMARGVVRAVKDYNPQALVVPSGYADAHRIGAVNPLAIPYIAKEAGADAAMLDTFIKDGSGLFDHLTVEQCRQFVSDSHEGGLFSALAGSVKSQHLADLAAIGTDIIGVRGAVCSGGDRNKGRIQPELIVAFRKEMDAAVAKAGVKETAAA